MAQEKLAYEHNERIIKTFMRVCEDLADSIALRNPRKNDDAEPEKMVTPKTGEK